MLGLRYAADAKTLLFIAAYFVDTYVVWNFGNKLGPWYYPLWILMCYLSFVGSVVTHNSMHVSVFYNRWANKAFQTALSLTYGHPVSSFVPGHNLSHHRFTQTPKDYMRSSKVRFRWNLLNLLLFQPMVAGDVLKSDVRFLHLQREQRRPFFYNTMREFFVLMAANIFLLYVDWHKFLVLWYIPHFFAQVRPHHGLSAVSRVGALPCARAPVGGPATPRAALSSAWEPAPRRAWPRRAAGARVLPRVDWA